MQPASYPVNGWPDLQIGEIVSAVRTSAVGFCNMMYASNSQRIYHNAANNKTAKMTALDTLVLVIFMQTTLRVLAIVLFTYLLVRSSAYLSYASRVISSLLGTLFHRRLMLRHFSFGHGPELSLLWFGIVAVMLSSTVICESIVKRQHTLWTSCRIVCIAIAELVYLALGVLGSLVIGRVLRRRYAGGRLRLIDELMWVLGLP